MLTLTFLLDSIGDLDLVHTNGGGRAGCAHIYRICDFGYI